MTQEEFNRKMDEILKELERKNACKGNEYSRNNDRFHNFQVGAEMCGLHQPLYLYALRSKHEASIRDMIFDAQAYTKEAWLEKITDSIMYSILLYAMKTEGE